MPYSKTFYFLDGAEPKGAPYEMVKFFEKELNEKLKTRHLKIHIAVISTPRDQLISRLAEGRGDIAAGYLTITPDGLKQVDFSNPLLTGVSEIHVTGPSAPQVKNKQDLSGLEIHVQKSSRYYQSLMALNAELAKDGKDKVAWAIRKNSPGLMAAVNGFVKKNRLSENSPHQEGQGRILFIVRRKLYLLNLNTP